jgi:hypothetical protein
MPLLFYLHACSRCNGLCTILIKKHRLLAGVLSSCDGGALFCPN